MWDYDAGEPYAKKKHGWAQPYAGVKDVRRGNRTYRVGCCPRGISQAQAQALVNSGIPYFDDPAARPPPGTPPDRIFLVHDGVPYEARWTAKGRSLHAFPVLPELFADLPNGLRTYLATQAQGQGHDLEEWLQQWKR
jgi:hypothetical protein